MAIEKQLAVARKLASGARAPLSDADLALLQRTRAYSTSDEAILDNETLYETFVRGYLYLAAKDETFASPTEIKTHFGKTLRETFPEANDTFLRFATTYWTFRLWLDDEVEDEAMGGSLQGQPLVSRLLRILEVQIAGLFFPTPGPQSVAPDKREAAQRQLFENFGVPIDVEAFITGNPILIRDRAQRSGCLPTVAILVAVLLILVLFVALV